MPSSSAEDLILLLENVSISFGGIKAVDGVLMKVARGELLGLIGPNGAGKTTIFNLVTAVYRPESGGVIFEGKDITRQRPYSVTRLGIARTFQNPRVFK